MTLPRLLACALALALALPAVAQAPFAPTSPEAHADDAPDEGIHVSGAWTITVREPDGTLVDQRDFSNALTREGAEMIAETLTSLNASGTWVIFLLGGACAAADNSPTFCRIEVPSSDISANQSASGEIILSGSTTVEIENSEITSVSTGRRVCDSTVTPSDCISNISGLYKDFTFKNLGDQSISGLESGQMISVKVTITFSTQQ